MIGRTCSVEYRWDWCWDLSFLTFTSMLLFQYMDAHVCSFAGTTLTALFTVLYQDRRFITWIRRQHYFSSSMVWKQLLSVPNCRGMGYKVFSTAKIRKGVECVSIVHHDQLWNKTHNQVFNLILSSFKKSEIGSKSQNQEMTSPLPLQFGTGECMKFNQSKLHLRTSRNPEHLRVRLGERKGHFWYKPAPRLS